MNKFINGNFSNPFLNLFSYWIIKSRLKFLFYNYIYIFFLLLLIKESLKRQQKVREAHEI